MNNILIMDDNNLDKVDGGILSPILFPLMTLGIALFMAGFAIGTAAGNNPNIIK